jgi:hypothetical protein
MRGPAPLLIVLATALLAPFAPASAEFVQHGDLFVHFGGGISPRDLPRNSFAPIGVRIEGTIRASATADPPPLRGIAVALNRDGRLSSRGLPLCRPSQISSEDPAEALSVCGPALVGTGGFTAVSSLPGQPADPVRGEILLFNGRLHGHPAIVGHLFERVPAPAIRIVVFHIHRIGGTFGTLISARLPPPAINRNGYLTSLYLQLQRNYVSHGHHLAYLSASCATPPGVSLASFPFARATMDFSDGRSLSSTLIRTCRVRHS